MFIITSAMTNHNEFQSERIYIYILELILAWRLRAATAGPRARSTAMLSRALLKLQAPPRSTSGSMPTSSRSGSPAISSTSLTNVKICKVKYFHVIISFCYKEKRIAEKNITTAICSQ